jgi:hypothetical protein
MPAPKDPEARARWIQRFSEANRGKRRSPETRAKMSAAQSKPEVRAKKSAAMQGRRSTAEHRAKISAALKGKRLPPETRAKLSAAVKKAYAEKRLEKPSGPDNPLWKGDATTYYALHTWLRRHFPKTGTCETCGTAGRTEYAFKHHPAPHTRNRDDYSELCPKCHRAFDDSP